MTIIEDHLRYPVGTFTPERSSDEVRRRAIDEIAALPARMREAVADLADAQLDTPYRPGGWTVRQVVHHVADSHMNGFTRMKLALTQERPAVVPYDEKAFALLPDMTLPVGVSLDLLEGLHARWAAIYRGLHGGQFSREFLHPEYPDPQSVDTHLQMYAWHSRHHVAHIIALRRREGW